MITRVGAAMLIVLCVACSPTEEAPAKTVGSDAEPAEVVASLFDAIEEGRFEDTVALTDAEQAGLVTLAEGADASDVVEVLEDGGSTVTSNFWSGFAQTLDPESLSGERTVELDTSATVDGMDFATVLVTPGESSLTQRFVLRRDGGWKVDMLATFGPVLAERLLPAVEGLLSSANSNSSQVLATLNDNVSSLRAALTDPALQPSTHQAMLGLIERITRAAG